MEIYLAAPLFTEAERAFNQQLTHELEADGHAVYLPQRDTAAAAGTGRTQWLFAGNVAGLRRAQALVAVCDGAQVDDGTAWEIGFAYGRGIPVYGLRTDRRITQQADEPITLMVLESLSALFTSREALRAHLAERP